MSSFSPKEEKGSVMCAGSVWWWQVVVVVGGRQVGVWCVWWCVVGESLGGRWGCAEGGSLSSFGKTRLSQTLNEEEEKLDGCRQRKKIRPE